MSLLLKAILYRKLLLCAVIGLVALRKINYSDFRISNALNFYRCGLPPFKSLLADNFRSLICNTANKQIQLLFVLLLAQNWGFSLRSEPACHTLGDTTTNFTNPLVFWSIIKKKKKKKKEKSIENAPVLHNFLIPYLNSVLGERFFFRSDLIRFRQRRFRRFYKKLLFKSRRFRYMFGGNKALMQFINVSLLFIYFREVDLFVTWMTQFFEKIEPKVHRKFLYFFKLFFTKYARSFFFGVGAAVLVYKLKEKLVLVEMQKKDPIKY